MVSPDYLGDCLGDRRKPKAMRVLNWMFRLVRPRRWWRLTVNYTEGHPIIWAIYDNQQRIFKSIPQIGEKHGDRYVLSWEIKPMFQ